LWFIKINLIFVHQGIIETRDYMRARMELARTQAELAEQVQTPEAWTVVLNHHLECLRLCKGDNMGLRYKVPFLLLRLNRDDDAFCFCLHWLKQRDDEDNEDEDNDRRGHSHTKEGDWIYPQEKDCRFNDLLHEIRPNTLGEYFEISLVVAVAVIKMRLVAVYDHRMKEFESFAPTPASKRLRTDELSEVRSSIMGSAEEQEKYADQRRQLNVLLDALQQRNASVVPALLYPDPLLKQPSPDYFSHGTPSEAHMVLKFAIDMWKQIPGADALLESRFGTSTPSYPATIQS
jgi:hypothetical protein